MAALAEAKGQAPRTVAANALRKAIGCEALAPTALSDNVSLVATATLRTGTANIYSTTMHMHSTYLHTILGRFRPIGPDKWALLRAGN